jgi:hypothetical protein
MAAPEAICALSALFIPVHRLLRARGAAVCRSLEREMA